MAIQRSSIGSTLQAFDTTLETGGGDANSVHDQLHRLSGYEIEKTITLSANNTTASENIYQITGTVQIFRLFGTITDATTLVNLTASSYDLYDSTAAVQITAATGVLSGMPVGTYIFKGGLAANAYGINDATAGSLEEQTYEGSDVFSTFVVTQKSGANTYIRFTYTTTDAPINAQINMFCEYRGLDGGTLVAV